MARMLINKVAVQIEEYASDIPERVVLFKVHRDIPGKISIFGHGLFFITPRQAHRLADELHRLARRAEGGK